MTQRRRSWWGWGWEDEAMTPEQVTKLGGAVAARLGTAPDARRPAAVDDLDLPEPRVKPPGPLDAICSTATYDRAAHTYGKSYRDVVRAFNGDLQNPPDLVAYPRDEADVVAILDWCTDDGIAAIPYGGGSSVVGGVEARVGDGYGGAVSIDLTGLDRVIEIDRTSRAARIQGGALGPVLEDQLRPEGYTLRHFPQSFEFSTLGGWLATRSGGHYASVYTHIDDLVESMRVVTPAGVSESRRLPGSGAGPSPDRLFLGSEGSLGIITEAWMRIQDRPVHKASAGVHFTRFDDGVGATRAVAQSALFPTNCRLLDPGEAAVAAGVGDGSALLVLGFESADHPVGPWIERAVELCLDHGGTVPDGVKVSSDNGQAGREGAVGAWRSSFLRAPYTRDGLVAMSMIVETFETACTWDRAMDLYDAVRTDVGAAVRKITGSDGVINCRTTHAYPDGIAPYFTVIAAGR
ncbi:MAG: FAD-binding oxidoreductase, partial [Actinomycetota bacterium]